MRPLATLLACLALAGLAVAAEGGAARSSAAGSYIVVFKSNAVQGATVATTARQLASAHTGKISFVYSHALEGFAVRMTPTGAGRGVARDARGSPTSSRIRSCTHSPRRPRATWGLDRIDQRDLPLNHSYYGRTGAACTPTSSTPESAHAPGVRRARRHRLRCRSRTATARTTATATGPTSPERRVGRRTALRSR